MTSNDENVRGVVWVLGVGASAGLGAAVARRFAREGLTAVVSGRTEQRLEQVAQEIRQTFAREFGPRGIHVAHIVIDGGIDGERLRARNPQRAVDAGEDGLLAPDAIADVYWHLHAQPRSAWTHELDLRPYKETF